MTTKAAFPPTRIHQSQTKVVTPGEAQRILAQFLEQTKTKAHLHPDALLSSSGIAFSASSGPNGGLALHHLRRIEAGLRGENLAAETEEELARFADEDALEPGDDTRLDSEIERTRSSTAREQQGRRKGGLKRQRSLERVDRWEDGASSSQIAGPAGGYDEDVEADKEDLGSYEKKQKVVEGEVGNRRGANVVEQNGEVPEVQIAADGGEGKKLTEVDKAARKAAKRARTKERKMQQGHG